jgi:adenine nucleotide transporter 17
VEPYADATLDAVAGAGGALLALLTTYPLMTLNTRQHTEHRAGKQKGRRDGTSDAPTPKRGMVAELRQLINEEGGVTALYRGVEPAIIGTVASQFVYNYFYSAMRNKYIAKKRTNPGPLSNLAIASAAGCVNVMCTIPIWTITTRMQARRKKMDAAGGRRGRAGKKKGGKSLLSSSWAAEGKETDDDEDEGESMKGFLATAREVWNDGGAAGFWQGVVPSLVMVSNPAMQYGAFIFLVSVRAIGLTGKCFLFNSALRDSRRRVQARQA